MSAWFSHASGTIIMIACGRLRPPSVSSSTTSSNDAESLAPSLHDREERAEVAEQVGFELALPRAHPVAVALHGVDLAVVRDHAERLRERPGREGVGRVARVDEREARGEPLVAEVRVERLELQRRDHALVDQGAGRQRREVGAELALRALAQAERLPVEVDPAERDALVVGARRLEEQLLEGRCGIPSQRAEVLGIGRDIAPARARRGPPRRRSGRCRPSARRARRSSRGRNDMPTA